MKKFGVHVCIGIVITIIGVFGFNMSSSYSSQDSFELLMYAGIWYVGITVAIAMAVITLRLYKKSKPYVEDALTERDKTKAYEELLRLKKLLDENIISKEEFELKARELKLKML